MGVTIQVDLRPFIIYIGLFIGCLMQIAWGRGRDEDLWPFK